MSEIQLLSANIGHAAAASTQTSVGTPAEGHKAGLPQLNPHNFAPQLVWLALTFGALYLIMSRVALPRIAGVMEKRQRRISGDLEEAKKLGQQAQDAEAGYKKALADAKANAHALAQSTRDKLATEVDSKRHEAEQKLSVRLLEAEQRIASSKQTAMAEVGTIGSVTTQEIVKRLIGVEASAEELKQALGGVGGR